MNQNNQNNNNQPANRCNPAPAVTRGKEWAAALKSMAKAWYRLTKANETAKAEDVKKCGREVFGQTGFEIACEEAEGAAVKKTEEAGR